MNSVSSDRAGFAPAAAVWSLWFATSQAQPAPRCLGDIRPHQHPGAPARTTFLQAFFPLVWQCQWMAPSSSWTSRWLWQSPRRTSPGCPSNTLKEPRPHESTMNPPSCTHHPAQLETQNPGYEPVPAAHLEQPPTTNLKSSRPCKPPRRNTGKSKSRLACTPVRDVQPLSSSRHSSTGCVLQRGSPRCFPSAGEWVSSNPKS